MLGIVSIRGRCLKNIDDVNMHYKWMSEEMIQNNPIKEYVLKRLSTFKEIEIKKTKFIFQSYLRSQKRKFYSVDIVWTDSISKATSQRRHGFNINGKKYLVLNLDIAFVIETKFIPNILKEFSERTSYNLSPSVLDHLYIIAKSSHEEKTNKNTTEWSYSFCHIENHIFTDVFTDTHRLIYLVTKSIFKKHIQPLDNNLLTSYLMKTILFWRFENEKFSQEDWFNGTMILSQTHSMFKDFKRFLEKGFLPMYFIPKLNLIERMNEKLRQDVIDMIENNIFNSSLEELFNLEELKEVQWLFQDLNNFILYTEESKNFHRNFVGLLTK